ncbi:MAG TPA: hypothetical protein VFB22_07875 [Candidatus Baltobacteraceae bacterium]|nr:hypothetical protein [Candidatus Baltobacteraceae bacterium]
MNAPVAASATPPILEPAMGRAWQLFRRGWGLLFGIVLLAVAVDFVVWAVVAALTIVPALVHGEYAVRSGPRADDAAARSIAFIALIAPFALLAWWWTIVATFGVADALAVRGSATLLDATRTFARTWTAFFVAAIGYFGVCVVAVILAIPTLGLSLFAVGVFLMYVPPAIVSGRRGGFAAIGESFRIVRRRFGTSLLAYVILLAVYYGLSFVSVPFFFPVQAWVMTHASERPMAAPPLGAFAALISACVAVSSVATIAYWAFAALFVTVLYRSLTDPAGTAAAGTPAAIDGGSP